MAVTQSQVVVAAFVVGALDTHHQLLLLIGLMRFPSPLDSYCHDGL